MRALACEAINDHLTRVEFAIQDLLETGLLESASYALSEVDRLRGDLERYVQTGKGTENGYRIQSCGSDWKSGQEPSHDRRT